MEQISPTCKLKACPCGQFHQMARRTFMRSLLAGAIAFPFLPVTQPAIAAAHQPKALVLSCIDFRFVTALQQFLEPTFAQQYDWTALAGASLALAGFPHQADAAAFWDQLDLSYRLHHVEKVIIFDHQDCGAYASLIDPQLSKNPDREEQVHKDYLNRAYSAIKKRYPQLNVELYFLKLDREVKSILPANEIPQMAEKLKVNYGYA